MSLSLQNDLNIENLMSEYMHDIFISYSRKDINDVRTIVNLIESRIPTIKVWFDVKDIESGAEFEEKIVLAIDNSQYVIFVLSDHSIESQWSKDEVMYAKNTGKHVIPILLNGVQLKGWFLLKFGRIDCIDISNKIQVDKLINNLSSWLDKAQVDSGNRITKKIIFG